MTKKLNEIILDDLKSHASKEEKEWDFELLREFSHARELAELTKVLKEGGLHEDQERILTALITFAEQKSCCYP